MVTTSPEATLPLTIGLVVTFSFALKFGDPDILPVTDLSPFFLQFLRVGTPRGALDTLSLTLRSGDVASVWVWPPPRPNSEKVARGELSAFTLVDGFAGPCLLVFGGLLEGRLPNKEKVVLCELSCVDRGFVFCELASFAFPLNMLLKLMVAPGFADSRAFSALLGPGGELPR